MQAFLYEAVVQSLDTGLMQDWRVGVGLAGPGLVRVLATLAVDMEQRLRFAVVRLEHVVADRPGWRDPVDMLQLAEILLPQAEERGAIDL